MYSVSNTLSEYTYQKTLLHTLLLLVSKIIESLRRILNAILSDIGNNSEYLFVSFDVVLMSSRSS